MKKIIAIVFTLFLINCSHAQVRFGVKAGGNLANIEGFDHSKMRLGISAGPALQINLAQLFFIQPELLYSIKGFESPHSAPDFSDPSTVSLNYINLPVLVGFRAAQNFSIKLGPEIGRLLSAKSEVGEITKDLSDIYEEFDFGADLGFAYTFKKLAIDLRYNYGLKDLLHGTRYDQYGVPIAEEESFGSNRVLQFSLCYFFK